MEPKEKMLSMVDDYLCSGKIQKEFCKKAGVGIAKLNYWVRKSKEMAVPAGFIALTSGIDKELTLENIHLE